MPDRGLPEGGDLARLFEITEPAVVEQRPARHHLIVTGPFFTRHASREALRQTLHSADVARQLERAGDRTVELH